MKTTLLVLFSLSLYFVPKTLAADQAKNLWLARFTSPSNATAVVASAQTADLEAIQQSGLFGKVSSFRTETEKPDGAWELSADAIDYSHGSTAKSMLVGFGSGRAHLVMEYKLKNPAGETVWTSKIKTHPSFWSSAVTDLHNAKADRQAQKLLDELTKFMQSQKQP
ncbi:MAG TPA: hypothetical protein VNM47_05945 [Terriglobia bacterium]|nr:hypothetical protein [Terriglobia bacterium]